jgi:hypothetical protein
MATAQVTDHHSTESKEHREFIGSLSDSSDEVVRLCVWSLLGDHTEGESFGYVGPVYGA